jgi:hypothetical protein
MPDETTHTEISAAQADATIRSRQYVRLLVVVALIGGLSAGGPAGPIDLPGIVVAGFATIGFGLVLGPEAPDRSWREPCGVDDHAGPEGHPAASAADGPDLVIRVAATV